MPNTKKTGNLTGSFREKIEGFIYQRLRRKFATGNEKPISDGERSSTPTFRGFVPTVKLQEVPLDYAREWLATMEHLAVYNPDVSYALDNIVQLANTDHEITFADTVSAAQAKAMREFLKENEGQWYHNSGGQRSLKSDLITQVVINGALSAEMIPLSDLSGIKQIARVSPKYICFVYNLETDAFDSYQRLSTIGVKPDYLGMKKLNPITYKYIAWRRIFEGPYPTPPFIAAIEGLIIQKGMNDNLAFIIQKLGMLGFLSAEVTPPEQMTTETEQEYYNRLSSYLETKVYPQLEKNLGKGMVAGFKDTHKFTLQGNNMNVSGAEGLVKIVQLMIFAGLKQDPNMLGRNYSTTETFGRVILRKMISQVRDYQQVVDAFYSEMYYFALRLAGFSPGFVEVKSKTALVSDLVAEQQAETLKINNVIKKRDAGIIDQTKAANELEYEEAAEEGPKYKPDGTEITPVEDLFPVDDGAPPDGTPPDLNPTIDPVTGDPVVKKKGKKPAAAAEVTDEQNNEAVQTWEQHFKSHYPVYPYICTHCEKPGEAPRYDRLDFKDNTIQGYADRYFSESYSVFIHAVRTVTEKVTHIVGLRNNDIPVDHFCAIVYLQILRAWDSAYMEKQHGVCQSNVERIYTHYRKDKTIFHKHGKVSGEMVSFKDAPIPGALWDMNDFRAIEHALKYDNMYLGKLITDPDTKKRIYNMLRQRYIEGSVPFGNNPGWVADFKNQFSELLQYESWKIRRIIDTSVSTIRNDANLKYMAQAQVMWFEVMEVEDEVICEYCAELNGQTFDVPAGVMKIHSKMTASPGDINDVSPFATSVPLEELKGMSADALSAAGINQPPYHPHCRGRIIAVI